MTKAQSFSFEAMGTACAIHLYCKDAEAAEEAIDEVYRLEERYSRYREDSLLSEINRVAAHGGTIILDQETSDLMDYAFACYRKSDGLFDVTSGILRKTWNFTASSTPDQRQIDQLLPLIGLNMVQWKPPLLSFPVPGMQLDFGGIVKEYAVDQAAAICTAAGINHGLIDFGGDMRVLGPHPHGAPWRIDIRNPRSPNLPIAYIELASGAVATSGDYERYMIVQGNRYSHILNPLNGRPTQEVATVSISADNCLLAGTVSTIAMLKGVQAKDWLRGLGLPYFIMEESGESEATPQYRR